MNNQPDINANDTTILNPQPTGPVGSPSTAPSPQHSLPSSFPLVSDVAPWPEPVDGKPLLDDLTAVLRRFVILPKWAAETLALWIVHTYAFQLRDISAYIGIESPLKRCGKTTLLTVLGELANRALAAADISPPAFFRVIEEFSPTLLIDEADTFLPGNEQLRGIFNAGYKKKTAYVLRAVAQAEALSEEFPLLRGESRVKGNGSDNYPSIHPSSNPASAPLTINQSTAVARFSSWCPKALATIGHLPDTLADRCILIRMERKTIHEKCDPFRGLDLTGLRQKCKRFVQDHEQNIATARPQPAEGINDRAADIWEPLFALADLAGGDWPHKARRAAISLSASAQEASPISTLLLDIVSLLIVAPEKRLFTRTIVYALNSRFSDRPWLDVLNGKPATDLWLSRQLRPYGLKPRTIWIGDISAKGFVEADFLEPVRRYVSLSDYQALKAEWEAARRPAPKSAASEPGPRTQDPGPKPPDSAPRTPDIHTTAA